MKTGIQFGAGNIGRGFIGHLLWESGYTTVFVEVFQELVDNLRQRGSYPLRLLAKDGSVSEFSIDRIRAFPITQEREIAMQVAASQVAFTAVGVKNLPHVVPFLSEGIRLMVKERRDEYFNVFLCENMVDAPHRLREGVLEKLKGEERIFLKERVGFVGTVVARMVPVMGERFGIDDPLCVVAESYHRLPCDAEAIRGPFPQISGLEPVKNFSAEIDKKLFIHNLGHAVLAYIGYLKGYDFIHQAVGDDEIRKRLTGALDETQQAILRKYPDLSRDALSLFTRDLIERFANPAMMDTVQRVGRDPLRKLSPQDRLVGAVRLCLSQNVTPVNILFSLGAALHYDWAEDPEAVRLQEMLREKGPERVLQSACGLKLEEESIRAAVDAYNAIKKV